MNVYHDLRSVRSWLNQMYPAVPILVQRNAQHDKKSYFFLQDVREKFEDTGRGFYNTLRTVNIHLVTEGISASNPTSSDPYWKTLRVISFLRDRLLKERVIQQFLYNEEWFPLITWQKAGGSVLAGTYQLACTSIDAYDKESLLSEPITVVVPSGKKLFIGITNWPMGRPMAKSYVIYRKTGSSPDVWQAIKTVPISNVAWGETVSELTTLTSLLPTRNPPATSKQWMGYLKVDMATCNMTESMLVDDVFHGFVNVTFRSRAPQTWKPQAPITSVGAQISVS